MFSFYSALNDVYFAVWVSPVVQSSSPVVQSSSPVQWLYPPCLYHYSQEHMTAYLCALATAKGVHTSGEAVKFIYLIKGTRNTWAVGKGHQQDGTQLFHYNHNTWPLPPITWYNPIAYWVNIDSAQLFSHKFSSYIPPSLSLCGDMFDEPLWRHVRWASVATCSMQRLKVFISSMRRWVVWRHCNDCLGVVGLCGWWGGGCASLPISGWHWHWNAPSNERLVSD